MKANTKLERNIQPELAEDSPSSACEVVGAAETELKERIQALPGNLTARDVAAFLGVSLSTAYNIISQPGFPLKVIDGTTRKLIPKLRFVEWYLQ